MRRLLSSAVAVTAIASVAFMLACPKAPDEYFGEFLDTLDGGFITEMPRPLFKIDKAFRFKDPNGFLWSTPAGTKVDGASIPQFLWSFIGGPFEGAYLNASVIHDYYCRSKERTAHDTHRNFYYGMRASQVPEQKAKLMHWAVKTFGPDWRIERGTAIALPPVDLSDPNVLAAAVSKTSAVARTLHTSNGEILDVTTEGQVKASVETVEASADAYRQVFASKEFSSSPARLGLLSQAKETNLGKDVKPWVGNRIPTLNEAIVLTPENAPKIEAKDAPFKLEPRSKDLIRGRVDRRVLESTTIQKDR